MTTATGEQCFHARDPRKIHYSKKLRKALISAQIEFIL